MTDRTRRRIAADLAQGAAWLRSYHHCKSVVDAMIAEGDAVRVKPPTGVAFNMFGLTPAGAAKYLPGLPDIPTFDPPAPAPQRRAYNTVSAEQRRAERAAVDQRKMSAEAERAVQRDLLAEHMANGGTLRAARTVLDVGGKTVDRRWQEIVANLGHQAQ